MLRRVQSRENTAVILFNFILTQGSPRHPPTLSLLKIDAFGPLGIIACSCNSILSLFSQKLFIFTSSYTITTSFLTFPTFLSLAVLFRPESGNTDYLSRGVLLSTFPMAKRQLAIISIG
jgi:hypothetical protein